MTHGQIAAKVRSYKELHPELYCPVKDCLWRIKDAEGNVISECRKHSPQSMKGPDESLLEGK